MTRYHKYMYLDALKILALKRKVLSPHFWQD